MTYALSAPLQEAVYTRLAADPEVASLSGGAVYDRVPGGVLPPTYVTLGPEDVRGRDARDGAIAQHDFVVSVYTDAGGFQDAKSLAGAVSTALVDAPLVLARGTLISLTFLKARARRQNGAPERRIDLWFRARIEDEQP